MSDVTAEEIAAEMKEAHKIAGAWYTSLAAVFGDGTRNALTDVIARDRATVRKEARREGLKQAWAKVEEMMMAAKTGEKFLQSKRIAEAIRALMEPGT